MAIFLKKEWILDFAHSFLTKGLLIPMYWDQSALFIGF